MKKSGLLLLLLLLTVGLAACGNNDPAKADKKNNVLAMEKPVEMDVKPIQSYGNQVNQRSQGDEAGTSLYKAGDWFYATLYDRIAKFPIDEPQAQTVICNFGEGESPPTDISVQGEWIYFIVDEPTTENSVRTFLYRMKKDGSSRTKLAGRVEYYILTEKEIYYEKYNGGEPTSAEDTLEPGEFVMSLDGTSERELVLKGHLSGIDNGWIYHAGADLYRTRPDGKESEKVLDGELNMVDNCIVENDEVYFVRYDEKDDEKSYLMKKTINGKETVLDTSSDFEFRDITPLNKDGEWLYYGKGNKVYKINVNSGGAKRLVYQFEGEGAGGFPASVNSILLYDGNALFSAFERRVYVKRDGTVIDLGEAMIF